MENLSENHSDGFSGKLVLMLNCHQILNINIKILMNDFCIVQSVILPEKVTLVKLYMVSIYKA